MENYFFKNSTCIVISTNYDPRARNYNIILHLLVLSIRFRFKLSQ